MNPSGDGNNNHKAEQQVYQTCDKCLLINAIRRWACHEEETGKGKTLNRGFMRDNPELLCHKKERRHKIRNIRDLFQSACSNRRTPNSWHRFKWGSPSARNMQFLNQRVNLCKDHFIYLHYCPSSLNRQSLTEMPMRAGNELCRGTQWGKLETFFSFSVTPGF